MKKTIMALLFTIIAASLIYGCTMDMGRVKSDMLGIDVAKDAFNEARSLYVFNVYADTKAYDVYNYTLGTTYAKQAMKAYAKGKGPNFERARVFSELAIPHLKAAQKAYSDAETK
jgi:hypothetical protein